MRKRLLAAAVSVLMLCSCSMSMSVADMLEPPRMTEQQSAIYDALETAIGTDSFKLKYPRSGKNLSACTLQDLDGDGKEEAVVFYELESGGSTATWISILTQQDGGWKSVKQISGEAGEIDRLDFASILGKTKTVLVGWTATGEENSTCVFYSYEDGQMQRYDSGYLYHEMLIEDIDSDGHDEIVLCTLDDSRSSQMQLLHEQNGRIERTSVLNLPSRLTGYMQVISGKLAEGLPTIFADITLSNGGFYTVLAAVNTTGVTPVLEKIDEDDIGLYAELSRVASTAYCTDINGDGLVDIPVISPLPGYDEEEEDTLWLTSYISIINGQQTTVRRMVVNEALGYSFSLPDSWSGEVTVRKRSESNEWRFILYNGDLTDDASAEIVRIRAVSSSDYQDKFETAVYKTVATKGIYEYQISVPEEQAAGYELTVEEASALFSLLK
ncbi:MAG: hypothetical protein IKL92_01585 [Oscillospiraceae bacterium]|nr:hypothetical protein [Oscillospiraceae bacterium]